VTGEFDPRESNPFFFCFASRLKSLVEILQPQKCAWRSGGDPHHHSGKDANDPEPVPMSQTTPPSSLPVISHLSWGSNWRGSILADGRRDRIPSHRTRSRSIADSDNRGDRRRAACEHDRHFEDVARTERLKGHESHVRGGRALVHPWSADLLVLQESRGQRTCSGSQSWLPHAQPHRPVTLSFKRPRKSSRMPEGA